MPQDLVRYQQTGNFHFITFSCYRRIQLLRTPRMRDIFVEELERVRSHYEFVIAGYVVMPEHVHLLIGEPKQGTLASAIQVLKQFVAKRALEILRKTKGGERHFWMPRYFDFNVHNPKKSIEKLRYLHRNPVKRGLVSLPEDWNWSSFRHYAFREDGPVAIESDWTAWKRERIRAGLPIFRIDLKP